MSHWRCQIAMLRFRLKAMLNHSNTHLPEHKRIQKPTSLSASETTRWDWVVSSSMLGCWGGLRSRGLVWGSMLPECVCVCQRLKEGGMVLWQEEGRGCGRHDV